MSTDVPDGSGGSRRRRRRARRPSMSPAVLAQPSTDTPPTDTPPTDGSSGPVPAPPAEHPQPPPADHRHRAEHDDATEPGHRHGPGHGRGGARPHRRRGPDDHHWRELDGAGHTQLGESAALRARDANQPDAADLAAAERDVVIVHRHWKPEDDADRPSATRRTGRGRERRGR